MLKEKRARGAVMLKIFDALADTAMTVPAIIAGMLTAGYGASGGQMERSIRSFMDPVEENRAKREVRRRRYQRYSTMLRYLEKNQLISRRNVRDYVKLYVTKKGRKKLADLRAEAKYKIPVSGYSRSPGEKIIIVVYDIPEKLNRYRKWLREVLERLGCKKLQRSVWVGKVKIPQQLLSDLMRHKLEDYIEIIEVGSSGLMREIL